MNDRIQGSTTEFSLELTPGYSHLGIFIELLRAPTSLGYPVILVVENRRK